MIVQLIHNPGSRSHKPGRLAALVRAFSACGAKVVEGETSTTGPVTISSACDLICVSGGDGALRLVVSAMVESGTNIPICIYPAGTVNLIAREIGYPGTPELFVQQVMMGFAAGESARLHAPVIESDNKPFIACLSAGPDSLCVAAISPGLKRYIGSLAYGVALIKQMVKWPRQNFELIIEKHGKETGFDCEAFYVAKSHYFAGPWKLVEECRLELDHFYLIALSNVSRWNYARFMLYLALHRDIANLPFVKITAAKSLSIRSLNDMRQTPVFQVDGDSMTAPPSLVQMTIKSIDYCLPVAL